MTKKELEESNKVLKHINRKLRQKVITVEERLVKMIQRLKLLEKEYEAGN